MGGNDQSKPVPKFPPVEESSPRQRGRRSPVRTTLRLRRSSPTILQNKASEPSQADSSSSSLLSGSSSSPSVCESVASSEMEVSHEPHILVDSQTPQLTVSDHSPDSQSPGINLETETRQSHSVAGVGYQFKPVQCTSVEGSTTKQHEYIASARADDSKHSSRTRGKRKKPVESSLSSSSDDVSASEQVSTQVVHITHKPKNEAERHQSADPDTAAKKRMKHLPTISDRDHPTQTQGIPSTEEPSPRKSDKHRRRVRAKPPRSKRPKIKMALSSSSSDESCVTEVSQDPTASLLTSQATRRLSYGARLTEHDISQLLEVLSGHTNKWKQIGLALGFTLDELEVIQSKPLNLSGGPEIWLVDMLNKWVQWTPEMGNNPRPYASLESLEKALQKPLGVVAENLRQMFKGETEDIPEQVSPSQPPVQITAMLSEGASTVHSQVRVPIAPDPSASPFEHYAFYLRSYYSQHEQPDDKFPHLEPKRFIKQNLAVVSNKYDNEQELKEFQKATVHGSIDDIVEAKAPIDFPDILQPFNSNPPPTQTLLVEGAPGTGKSVMSRRVCQSWGKGEHFQEYELVVMLRFRDPWVQKIQSVSDLFRFPRDWSPESQRDVVTPIKQSQGLGVLFILDGYDEAPSSLRKSDSLFYELFTGSLLPNATVMVTTRPSASESLRKRCRGKSSRRIEVLGFSRKEIDEYIESHISDSESRKKFHKYLELYPHIRSMMYIPLNSAIVTTVYQSCKKTSDVVPKTMTQLYTALVKILLLRYLDEKGYEGFNIDTFDDLPQPVLDMFRKVCQRAYDGIIKPEIEIIFTDLPLDFNSLGLMQSSPELYIDKGALHSHNFLHLTIQEFLAAYHLSRLSEEEQVSFLKNNLESKVTVSRFLAGLTRLRDPVCKAVWDIDSQQGSSDCYPRVSTSALHIFFELQDPATLSNVLGSKTNCIHNGMNMPFDFYVLGYCIAVSCCKWELSLEIHDDEHSNLFIKGLNAFEQRRDTCTLTASCRTSGITKLAINNSLHKKVDITPLLTAPPYIFQDTTHLTLSGSLTPVSYSRLAQLLRAGTLPELKVLDVISNYHEKQRAIPVSITELLKCLSQTIETLKLRWIGKCYKALRDVLASSNCSIECLDIGANSIMPTSVQHIIDGLSHNTSLKSLCMSESFFNLANIASLTSVLQTNTTLTDLNLTNCGIDDDGVVSLSSVLEENGTLKKLDLSNAGSTTQWQFGTRTMVLDVRRHCKRNSFTSRGVTALCRMLSKNTHLTSLSLNDCNLQNEGAILLANALKENTTLEVLMLNKNNIGDESAITLADMLKFNSTLEFLSLSENNIGDEGAIALVDMLKLNSTLEYLSLSENNIGDEGAIALVDMLKLNSKSVLRTLDLQLIKCTRECMDQLEHSVQQLRHKNVHVLLHVTLRIVQYINWLI